MTWIDSNFRLTPSAFGQVLLCKFPKRSSTTWTTINIWRIMYTEKQMKREREREREQENARYKVTKQNRRGFPMLSTNRWRFKSYYNFLFLISYIYNGLFTRLKKKERKKEREDFPNACEKEKTEKKIKVCLCDVPMRN